MNDIIVRPNVAAMLPTLEWGTDGRPTYLHAPECPSFCDYACNPEYGDEVADALLAVLDYAEQRDMREAQSIKTSNVAWSRVPHVYGHKYHEGTIEVLIAKNIPAENLDRHDTTVCATLGGRCVRTE